MSLEWGDPVHLGWMLSQNRYRLRHVCSCRQTEGNEIVIELIRRYLSLVYG